MAPTTAIPLAAPNCWVVVRMPAAALVNYECLLARRGMALPRAGR